ncbi:MAG TPA: FUSC family protein [Acidobacteriaceae bacterium]|nr:FUSC family protein [Acidobacteriaceae bacterium]
MASAGKALPSVYQLNSIDDAGKWLWNFLKTELAPYPGRAWVVGRVTIAATLVMLVIMTFQIPNGFLGAIFTLFLSRENPTATFFSGLKAIAAFMLATLYTLIGAAMFVADPLTHFLGVGVSLFVSFFLISITNDYGTAVAFGFTIAGAIPLWDRNTLNINDRVSDTLWLGGVVAIGIVISIIVEYVFRRVHPVTDLTEGIESRLHTVENVLRCAAAEQPLNSALVKSLSLYSSVGVARLRRLILRSRYSLHFKSQLGAAVALLGQLVDVAANFQRSLEERAKTAGTGDFAPHIDPADKARCLRLADAIEELGKVLATKRMPEKIQRPAQPEPSQLPFLSAMERIVALMPAAFSGSSAIQEFVTAPLDEEQPTHFFAPDAFSNPAHVQFAVRGTMAAMATYIIYTAIDWPGLSTSIATCIITALSTIGSSRQKQFLRLGGVIVGGIIIGFGAQIFVLPYLDSIAGFTLLFMVVTAISSWIATSSPRLSYLGVQLALAFYLINLQEFTIQTSLSIARDRVFGVLLGLMSMWLIYDRLWQKNALDEMQRLFARNLEMFAELTEQLLEKDQIKAILRIRQLRDQLNAGFQAVSAQADAILFEFGPSRQRKLQIREDFQRWQPSIRTLLQVQITSVQYLVNRPLSDLPQPIAQAGVAFEQDVAKVMHAMASEASGKPVAGVPDISISAAQFQEAIRKYYQDAGAPVPTQASDVLGLAESLATIIAPLYEDIRDTFAAHNYGTGSHIQLAHGQA